jgi:queuine/archaeosine tRNA-ribosyltransferase
MKKFILVMSMLLSVGCQSVPVKKFRFSKDLDMTRNWAQPCIYMVKEKMLFCVTEEEFLDLNTQGALYQPRK